MKAILIDSSASACSVCVTTDKVVKGHNYVSMDRGHASAIVPMIESTLKGAKTLIEELRFVAVTKDQGRLPGLGSVLLRQKLLHDPIIFRCLVCPVLMLLQVECRIAEIYRQLISY